jgi:hypothetical protein
MDQNVSHPDYFVPGNQRILVSEFIRKPIRGFSDYFKPPIDCILFFNGAEKIFLGQTSSVTFYGLD